MAVSLVGRKRELDFQRRCPARGHPVDLLLEALDVLRLLHELVFRYQEGKLGLLMIGIQKLADNCIDILFEGKAEGKPDAHALDGISVIDDLRRHEQFMIPLAKAVLAGKLGLLVILCLGFNCLGIGHVTTDIAIGVIKVSMSAARKSSGVTMRQRK